MAENLNMLLESVKYADIQDFLRSRDNREALAAFVIDEGHRTTFFSNFPQLVHQEYFVGGAGSKGNSMVGDVVKIRFRNFTMGIGVPGMPSTNRQLSGNEAPSRSAHREEQISFGGYRYAVAIEQMKTAKVMPQENLAHVMASVSKHWAGIDDIGTFMTLFRDYPYYVAETQGLSGTLVNQDVATLFGRGFNDLTTGTTVDLYFAGNGTKGDIEPGTGITGYKSAAIGDKNGLNDTDTLTDTFLKGLGTYIGNVLKMPALEIMNEKPFFGMIIEQADVDNMIENSSATLIQTLTNFTAMNQVSSETIAAHPVFSRVLGQLYQIKFMKYSQVDPKVDPRIMAPNNVDQQVNTIYDDLYGKAIKPEAKVLAATESGNAITGLTPWTAGYLLAGVTRDHTQGAYQLYVSSGADMFPFFNDTATYGADSINQIDKGFAAGGASTGTFLGRLQVGTGITATTRWKITYKGPYYSGPIQIGDNLGKNTFVEDAFKLEVVGLYRWNNSTGKFETTNSIVADWATFKTFLGINGTTRAIDPTLITRTMYRNRRVHMFDTVRTICFGKSLIYKINGEGVDMQQETRDYGAYKGWGLNVIQGKKIVTSGQGLVNNYAIVAFKRPFSTI